MIFNNTLDDSTANKEDCYGHEDPKQNILALFRLGDYRSRIALIILMISLIFLLIYFEAFQLKANFNRRCQKVIDQPPVRKHKKTVTKLTQPCHIGFSLR